MYLLGVGVPEERNSEKTVGNIKIELESMQESLGLDIKQIFNFKRPRQRIATLPKSQAKVGIFHAFLFLENVICSRD